MADSGTGKSTIAQFMDHQKQGLRIADDIVPLKSVNNNLTILPHFPQLKLNSSQQYGGSHVSNNIIFLFAHKSNRSTKIKSISHSEGLKKLVKHTVASKLFSENDLNKHLQFCHSISQENRCFALHYQHTKDSLRKVYNLLYENF